MGQDGFSCLTPRLSQRDVGALKAGCCSITRTDPLSLSLQAVGAGVRDPEVLVVLVRKGHPWAQRCCWAHSRSFKCAGVRVV